VRSEDQARGPLPDASPFRFAVVVSRFNETVTASLRDAALAALKEAGATDSHVQQFSVPGAFEIPQAARAGSGPDNKGREAAAAAIEMAALYRSLSGSSPRPFGFRA
jgi:6,7-dimethyl-8-ribityllumazine synthase